MTGFLLFLLIGLVVTVVIILSTMNNPGPDRTDYSGTSRRPTAPPPRPKPSVVRPQPVVPRNTMQHYTAIYEYIPSCATETCIHCDGESPVGSEVCRICGRTIHR